MAQFVDCHIRDFTAGEALEEYRRVKLSGDYTVSYADAGDRGIGTNKAAVASAGRAAIILDNKMGTNRMVANGTITQNANVYPAADGKITATVTGERIGKALQAASADGDVIEVLVVPADEGAGAISGSHVLSDDLNYYIDADLWTLVATDSGTATLQNAANGVVQLKPSDGTVADNDEVYFATTVESFLFADDKPLFFEARIKLTEANTDDANVLVGLMDGVAANALQDDGAGPKASYSGAVFYKVDGGTAWLAEVSDSTTQTAVTLTGGAVSSGSWVRFGIEFIPTAANTATVNFYIDGTLAGSTTGFDYSNATELDLVVGAKNGGANNETVDVDYIHCDQVR